jgi:hypothetical protein
MEGLLAAVLPDSVKIASPPIERAAVRMAAGAGSLDIERMLHQVSGS